MVTWRTLLFGLFLCAIGAIGPGVADASRGGHAGGGGGGHFGGSRGGGRSYYGGSRGYVRSAPPAYRAAPGYRDRWAGSHYAAVRPWNGSARVYSPGFGRPYRHAYVGVGVRPFPGRLFAHAYIGPRRAWAAPHWGRGFWAWRTNAWIWVDGPWWVTPTYPGYIWIAPQWVWDGERWVWQEGYWSPY